MKTKYEPCSICEEYIKGVDCTMDQCPVAKLKAENKTLTEYNDNLLSANAALSCTLLDEVKKAKTEAIKEFAERLKSKFFNYYDGLTESTCKSNHNGDTLMMYEVADMIKDCIESVEEEMTEGER